MSLFHPWQLINVAMVVWKIAESSNKVAQLETLTGLALTGQTLKTITWDLAGVYATGLVVRTSLLASREDG